MREHPIERNPMIGSGAPTLKGIRTCVISGRFLSGESIGSIALDYGMTENEVQKAIRYEVLESTKNFDAELTRLRAIQKVKR